MATFVMRSTLTGPKSTLHQLVRTERAVLLPDGGHRQAARAALDQLRPRRPIVLTMQFAIRQVDRVQMSGTWRRAAPAVRAIRRGRHHRRPAVRPGAPLTGNGAASLLAAHGLWKSYKRRRW